MDLLSLSVSSWYWFIWFLDTGSWLLLIAVDDIYGVLFWGLIGVPASELYGVAVNWAIACRSS